MNDQRLIRVNNLKAYMKARGWSTSDLARAAGRRVSYFSDLFNMPTKSFGEKSARSIEEALGMQNGTLDASPSSHKTEMPSASQLALRPIPMLTWPQVQAVGRGATAAAVAEAFFRCPVDAGPNAYAVTVRGDSMTSPHGKSYPDGVLIIINPDLVPSSGSRVLARLKSGEVVFKVLRIEDGRRWLQPLNPQYPAVHEEFTLVGTVVGKWESE